MWESSGQWPGELEEKKSPGVPHTCSGSVVLSVDDSGENNQELKPRVQGCQGQPQAWGLQVEESFLYSVLVTAGDGYKRTHTHMHVHTACTQPHTQDSHLQTHKCPTQHCSRVQFSLV